jgi:cobalt-zinc-cadmium efflux system membrane fusion protein
MKIYQLYFIYILCFGMGCRLKDKEAGPAEKQNEETVVLSKEQISAAGIVTGHFKQGRTQGIISCNGLLDVPPQNLITISTPMGGFVKQTDLLQGMRITKGQILVVMQHPDYISLQQEYIETNSRFLFATQELERQQTLSKEQVNALKSLQQAQADYTALKSKVMALEARLQMINISPASIKGGKIVNQISVTSPINGYVKDVKVNIGKYVSQNDMMFELINTEHLHAELQIFEKDYDAIQEGQTIRFSLAQQADKARTAKVHLIGRTVEADKTIRIHGHLDQEDPSLIPGMFITASIETKSEEAWALPEDAVVNTGDQSYIFWKSGNSFHRLQVEVKEKRDGLALLTLPKNFDVNKEVVFKGARSIMGALVNVPED